jgi:hypothetical protein
MFTRVDRRSALRFVAGLALGWATSWTILTGGFSFLRVVWPDYALAEPEKAYTLTMLFVRLVIFSAMIATTAAVATLVAADRRVAWIAGGIILALSFPPHLCPGYVWDDYPAWYHLVYLFSILPIAVYGGRWVQRVFPGAFLAESAAQRGAAAGAAQRPSSEH